MSLNNVVLHEGFVPAYQSSAVPYVTCSFISTGEIQVVTFPQVTRFFNIQNIGTVTTDEIAVAFTQNGLDPIVGNYFTIGQGVSFRDEIRTTALYVSCSSGSGMKYQIVAGLTNIPKEQFLILTSSNGHQGVG